MTTDDKLEAAVGAKVHDAPVVSVVIPNYNTAKFIGETLESVFAQTFRDYEVIVINDGAPDTDELRRVLQPYLERIVFLDKTTNEGTSKTRNRAVENARGEILAFLDADDIWKPTFLDELLGFLRDNDLDVAYTDAETFGATKAGANFLTSNPRQGRVTRQMLINGECHILPSGTLIRKQAFDAAGGFDPGVARTEDFDLWMRMLFAGCRFGYLRKILFKFRLRPESGSGDYLVRLERCVDIWHTLRAKLEFTPEEDAIIDRHIAMQEAAVVRARGRYLLAQHDWRGARSAFADAAHRAALLELPLKHRAKLRAVNLGLRIAPSLVLWLFQNSRREELEYISAISP
jgi:glycosyltransferase involved in cell wall biosynthesis